MALDVFISFSSEDKSLADAVCNRLETKGIRCWIAPRDITPGTDWSSSVVEAIRDSKFLVLIFSTYSNNSVQVKREVERAVSMGKVIIPFRIEDIAPSSSLEYFISTAHWLDALTPPVERHIDRLVEAVSLLMSQDNDGKNLTTDAVFVNDTAKQEEIRPSSYLAIAFTAFIAFGIVGFVVLRNLVQTHDHVVAKKSAQLGPADFQRADLRPASPPTEDKSKSEDKPSKDSPPPSSIMTRQSAHDAFKSAAENVRRELENRKIDAVSLKGVKGTNADNSLQIENALLRSLVDAGVTVSSSARTSIIGYFRIVPRTESGGTASAIKVTLSIVDKDGAELAEFQVFIDKETDVAVALSATVSLPPNVDEIDRKERLLTASESSLADINQSRASTPDKMYSIEILSEDKPILISYSNGNPIVPLPTTIPFQIRITNEAPHAVFSRLYLNGLNTFNFSESANAPDGYFIPPRSSIVVKGWWIDPARSSEFLLSGPSVESSKYPNTEKDRGNISATFEETWPAEDPPPRNVSDDKWRRSTALGPDVTTQSATVQQSVGALIGVVSIRYGEP